MLWVSLTLLAPVLQQVDSISAWFVLLFVLMRCEKVRERPGLSSVVFLIGYASFRFIVEFFRQPDSQLGFVFLSFSMGQVLSAAMVAGGLILLFLIYRGKTKYDPA